MTEVDQADARTRDLRRGFDRLEAQKAGLLQSLSALEAPALNRRPDASAWSILQVIAHLTMSEAGTLTYIRKKTQDPKALLKSGLMTWPRAWALLLGFHSPFKFKAPSGIAEPPETSDLLTASAAWSAVREDWRVFVDGFPEVLHDRLIFRHPFVGLLGPAQVMVFLNGHLGNHVRQIARIRKALNV